MKKWYEKLYCSCEVIYYHVTMKKWYEKLYCSCEVK